MKIDQLLNKSVDLIISCDEKGNITEFNHAAEKTLGYQREEIRGKHISIISGKSEYNVSKQLLETGIYVGEVINKRKDGSEYLAFLSANLLYDDEGSVIGSMGVSRDISKQKEKEQQYTGIVENASHVIYTIGLDGNCSFVNTTVSKFFGYSVEEVIGKPFLEFVYEKDLERVSSFYFNQFNKSIQETTLEFRARTKEGSFKWVSQDVSALFSVTDAKKIMGFQGIVRIIDKVKRAENSLRETQFKYTELFKNSTDLIHSIDLEGNFNYVNETWKKRLGYSEIELKKINLFDLIHSSSRAHCSELIHRIANGEIKGSTTVTYKVVTKQGEVLVLEGGISFSKEEGRITTIQSFLRDITERELAREIIEKQNKAINSGINYAKIIQESVLPEVAEIDKIFTDYFLLYKPRDVVSGDFYIIDELRNNKKIKMPCFIIGDCTGHGIPGAVLSLMCNALVKDSFIQKEVNTPAEALDFTRSKLKKLFKSNHGHQMRDGMDASFCVLNREKMQLYFAGANLPCLIIRNGVLKVFAGDKQHIGHGYHEEPFTHHIIPVMKGDAVYIFSDGYHDQFGGQENKKFMKKRLYGLLQELSNLSMKDIGKIIEKEFYQWKGENDQVDDVSMIGIRI